MLYLHLVDCYIPYICKKSHVIIKLYTQELFISLHKIMYKYNTHTYMLENKYQHVKVILKIKWYNIYVMPISVPYIQFFLIKIKFKYLAFIENSGKQSKKKKRKIQTMVCLHEYIEFPHDCLWIPGHLSALQLPQAILPFSGPHPRSSASLSSWMVPGLTQFTCPPLSPACLTIFHWICFLSSHVISTLSQSRNHCF